ARRPAGPGSAGQLRAGARGGPAGGRAVSRLSRPEAAGHQSDPTAAAVGAHAAAAAASGAGRRRTADVGGPGDGAGRGAVPPAPPTPASAPTSPMARACGRLCGRLEGFRLAAELAAARATVRPPAEMLDWTGHRLPALGWDAPDLPVRHQSLSTAMEGSYALL